MKRRNIVFDLIHRNIFRNKTNETIERTACNDFHEIIKTILIFFHIYRWMVCFAFLMNVLVQH